MRVEIGRPPFAPGDTRDLVVWHFWDYPRWGQFTLDGELVAFHRHETVGHHDRGPSLWCYRPLDVADREAMNLPVEQWGEQWGQVYEAWRARTPARWWALVDHDLAIVRFGGLVPPIVDDDAWAAEFARELGIEPVDDPE